MKRKILGIFVMTLLIVTSLSAGGIGDFFYSRPSMNSFFNPIIIDQSQDEGQESYHITGGMIIAIAWQEFVPSMPALESIEIKIRLVTPVEPGNFVVNLKKGDWDDGETIYQWVTDLDTISTSTHWKRFYVPESLMLESGEKYTIYASCPSDADIIWYYAYGNPYPDGSSKIGDNFDFTFRTYVYDNNPPNTPSKPSGPASGNVDVSYAYSTSTTDPDGEQVSYGWDWNGDSIVDEWTSQHSSGATISSSHTWTTTGTYNVKVKAKDSNNAESGWSLSKTVVIGSNNPPTVSITYPDNGETVSDIVAINGEAHDPDGDEEIRWVKVRIDDGSWLYASGKTSWSYNWNTNIEEDGYHTISAITSDGYLQSTVDTISVFVDNEEEPTGNVDLIITDIWNEEDIIFYQIRNIENGTVPGGHNLVLFVDDEQVLSEQIDGRL